ncbi:MAG: N-acetylglutaminylglutamine amidotransferase [Pseudomonadota bacterium]|nr:N-acetylglutaminylglutamine amidotransferase [Pseudomonadota bacterium]
MCGICGELRFDDSAPDGAAIGRMLARLARRGPDHEGSYSDGPLAFGHRRLSVIDLSAHANQPMVDHELGLALVFNGAIYNYPELRAELMRAGYHFFSTGDTEVILKAYHFWGEQCVTRFNGMFAFALWETGAGRLFLARDRLGIKPLYYSEDRRRLRFASNTQALLASGGIDTSLDGTALHHHLTLHAVVPAPRTVLNGVRKLAPAHTLSIEANGERRLARYWSLEARRPETPLSDQEWIDATRDALTRAVDRRLHIADVPVGVLLSGGLDSSLLVGLLSRAGVRDLKTYTVGFEDHPDEKGSEFEYSDPVADRFGTEHHKFNVPNTEVVERLPEAVDAMAEPMVAQDAVAFYLLSERVVQDVKVVQSGQGADEVFGGYFWYPLMETEPGDDLDRFRRNYFDRDHTEFERLVAPGWASGDFTSDLIAAELSRPGADTFLDAVLRMDVTTLIVDDPVKRVDNMTMAWGLEARVPFLDHEVVELAMRMPPRMKLREGGKFPLKRIARGLLPDVVIDRPKGYFPVPALKYVRGVVLDMARDVLSSQACLERGLFRRDYVEALLAAPEGEGAFTPIRGSKLWHLALLEMWLQRSVDEVASHPVSGIGK